MNFTKNIDGVKTSKMSFNMPMVGASCLLAAMLFSSTSIAGAWVAKKGSGYGKLAYADYLAKDFLGKQQESPNFTGKNTSFYAEYGLGGNFAIYGQLLYQDMQQTDSQGITFNTKGFGDTEIGVRYQWQAQPFVLSTSLLLKLPYLYDENEAFARGNGQEDIELRVLLGKSLNEYGYMGFELGYRLRTGAPSDEYRYLLEYGFNINENIYLRTKLDGVLSANNGDDFEQSDVNSNLSILSEYDSGKLEFSAGYSFDKDSTNGQWGLEFTYTREVYGDNILQGNSYQFALTRVF